MTLDPRAVFATSESWCPRCGLLIRRQEWVVKVEGEQVHENCPVRRR